jgi:tRNA pseudouridine55 synthase
MTERDGPNGVLVLDKPAGMTSHDAVGVMRRLLRTKRVGHTGTLDPDATGVLVLCIGYATRIAEYLSASRKCYRAVIRFGLTTDTEDASGTVTSQAPASHLTAATVMTALPAFRGIIRQTPPMYSAVHHEGKRLYELARQGIEVERAAREVEIFALEMTGFEPGDQPTAHLDLICSSGTYVRTLCADIGAAVGVGAIMQSLRRLWVGDSPDCAFTLEEACTLDELRELAEEQRAAQLLPIRRALFGWSIAELDDADIVRIRRGQTVPLADVKPADPEIPLPDAGNIAMSDSGGDVFAVGVVESECLQPRKVFV